MPCAVGKVEPSHVRDRGACHDRTPEVGALYGGNRGQ